MVAISWREKSGTSQNCPACFESPKERYRVKTLLRASLSKPHGCVVCVCVCVDGVRVCSNLFGLFLMLAGNLLRTMQPLMRDDSFHLRGAEAEDHDD